MTRVILIDPCKDERWDRFVESHPFGWVCHLSGWKRVLENSFPHMKGYYLALIDDNGEIKAGLPIYEVRSKLTGNRLVSIPFATLSDPLVSNCDELGPLLNATKLLSKDLRISNIEIRTTNCHIFMNDHDFLGQYYFKIHYIDLNLSLNELWKSFHKRNVRKKINRAQDKLEIIIGNEEKNINNFYKLYVETRKCLGLPPHPYSFIKAIFKEFTPFNRLLLYMAKYKNQIIAAHIIFRFNRRVSAEFEGWNRNYEDLGANPFLFWEEIKLAQNEGFKIYDFGRTSPKNESLMRFKNQWGTKVSDLPIFYLNNNYNHNRISLNEEKVSYNLTRKICRYAPTPILKTIGNLCYKHLG